jgi:multidrug efflux system membrane fusion protein
MLHHRISFAITAIPLALVLSSCSGTPAAADQQQANAQGGQRGQAGAGGRGGGRGRGENGPVPVLTAIAAEKAVPENVTTVGSGEAFTTVEVRAQVTGQLVGVDFTEGQDVTAGQTLFRIDSRTFEVTVQQAQATLEKDQAQANNSEALRKKDEDLLKNGLIARADYDTAVALATSQKATTAADQAALDSAKLQLQYTTIKAPVAGRTGALMVHVGSLVRNGDTNPMVVINQVTPIRVTFAVPGTYLPKIRTGQASAPLRVTAAPSGSTQPPAVGQVSFIDNTIDVTTGTIKLKANFPNADRRMWPGEIVQVTLQLAVDPHAVVVPSTAVQNSQQGQFVYIVGSDRTVKMQPVTVVRTVEDNTVIGTGVKAGDEVVTDGQLRLTPGAHVSQKTGGTAKGTS